MAQTLPARSPARPATRRLGQRPRHPTRLGRRPDAALVAVFVAALLLPAALTAAPLLVAAGVVALALGVVLATRLALTIGLFVVVSPFERYLDEYVSTGTIKALGAVVVGAALVRRLGGGRLRTPAGHPALLSLVLFLLLVVASTTAQPRGGTGTSTALRYLSFGIVCVIAVGALREARHLERVLSAFVIACTAASLSATRTYLTGGGDRAGGPLEDPNDLAFFLAAAVPLACCLAARAGRPRRQLWLLCAGVLLIGVTLTLSRGAAVALFVVLLWGLGRGLVRPGPLLVCGALVLSGLGTLAVTNPELVSGSLTQKSRIADRNVETRTLRWQAAALMGLDNPALGVGPGGFADEYRGYASAEFDDETDVVSHQMYLEVLAELGIPALASFLLMLAFAWRAAGRAGRSGGRSVPEGRGPPGDALLAVGVQGALLVSLSAALFLTEQYYLPIWLFVAAAVALETRLTDTPTAVAGTA